MTKKIQILPPSTVPVQQYTPPKYSRLKARLRKFFGRSEYNSVEPSDVAMTLVMWFLWILFGAMGLIILSVIVSVMQVWFFVIVAIISGLVLFVRWLPTWLNKP